MVKAWAAAVLLAMAPAAWAGDLERAALFAQLEARAPAAPSSRDTGVEEEIRAFNAPRAETNPDFLKEKLLRIAAGTWPFLRGTAHLFYLGLAQDPALSVKEWVTPASCRVVVQGDLHVQNIGTFENAN